MGTDGGPRDPSSCPSLSHEGGGADTLQSSLELGKGSPSCGLCPSLPAVPGSLAGVGDEERRTAHTDGAWCRLLLSWRGSKSNILQGRYFPCSAHAQFKRPLCSSKRASGLLFLMHTVKGKKNHRYPPSQGLQAPDSSVTPSEKRDHLCRGRPCRPLTPHRPLCGRHWDPERAAAMHGATWPPLPSSLASGTPKSMSQAHM